MKCKMGVVGFVDTVFRRWGGLVGRHPWKSIILCIIITFLLGLGWGPWFYAVENRPFKLWVPEGAVALDHLDYVNKNWPSDMGMESYVVTCGANVENCNMLEPENLDLIFQRHAAFYNIKFEGVETYKDVLEEYENDPDDPITNPKMKYEGTWVYDKNLYPGADKSNLQSKCYLQGNQCRTSNVFTSIFNGLDPQGAHPKNPNYFESNEANTLKKVQDLVNAYDQAPALGGFKVPLDTLMAGITRDANNKVIGTTHILTTFFVSNMDVRDKSNRRVDLLNRELELIGLCLFGIESLDETKSCPSFQAIPAAINVMPWFQRSLPDEFGNTIRGDIPKIGIACMLIVAYLFVMLGQRDDVHRMLGLSFCCVLVVGFAGASGLGLGYMMGIKDNTLMGTMWFLLLGLGVDNAFVLVAEFTRISKQSPEKEIPERIALTGESAGTSVFLTSLTDALAFLIGATTILPALRAFCLFTGMSIIFCLFFNITFLLPCIAINAKRAESNRFDVCCCCTAKVKHEYTNPQGCCLILKGDPMLPKFFGWLGKALANNRARGIVLVVFTALFGVGLSGLLQLQEGFKIEWFLPSESYSREFLEVNDSMFKQGTFVTFYIPESLNVDYYSNDEKVIELSDYMLESSFMIPDRGSAWPKSFKEYLESTNKSPKTASEYYKELKTWLANPLLGARFSKSVQFKDDTRPELGISHSRLTSVFKLEVVNAAGDRFDTMTKLRADTDAIIKGAFPYAFDFLWWEESGIIGTELIRNLIIAFAVIFVIVVVLIGDLKISLLVILGLFLSILEVCGFAHYYDIQVNGVATIYILLSVGLAVDYSAHIAHVFRISYGTKVERMQSTLVRIGPSVLNAVISTLLAVIVLSFSNSYVFRVFFRVLFLVNIIASAHGLILLPTVLGMISGDRFPEPGEEEKALPPEVKKDLGDVEQQVGGISIGVNGQSNGERSEDLS